MYIIGITHTQTMWCVRIAQRKRQAPTKDNHFQQTKQIYAVMHFTNIIIIML